MIKIIAGKYGPRLLGPGTILNLDADSEQRMVDRKVAVFFDDDQKDDSNGKLKLKTSEQIEKIKAKKDLVKYGNGIGLHDLDEEMSKETLVNAIINYQEETFREE